MKTAAVFGAGVAGLSAAHELVKRGYAVSVYEANAEAGGFFRSARRPADHGMPSEYSWHGLGPWYHNVFDVMKQIPFDDTHTVYEKSLSRPLNYGVVPDAVGADFDPAVVFTSIKRFRMSVWDECKWAYLLFKSWSANERSRVDYALRNASEAWKPLLTDLGWKTWRATFGPWIGSDWTRVSLHHAGLFFRNNLMPGAAHAHAADAEGPAWKQGPGEGWLLLRGPSNEFWFEKWVSYLQKLGVKFFWQTSLVKLDFDGHRVTQAHLSTHEQVQADTYILATNPFAAAEILERTPELEKLDQLKLFKPLIADGPHTQVSFRVAFSEPIKWTKERSAFVLADSPFDLTLFAQEQVWAPEVNLGEGVVSLWTGTACAGTVPGRLFQLPVSRCTKEQFIEEIKAQMLDCPGLDAIVRAANGGRSLKDFPVLRIEVWHEWLFSPDGIKADQPKWVMSSTTQPYLPTQATPVPNLVLAGAHTKTEADIWSIEGAVESGRRAVKCFEPSVTVIPQYKPGWLRAFGWFDDLLFGLGAPHILDALAYTGIGFLIGLILGGWAFSA